MSIPSFKSKINPAIFNPDNLSKHNYHVSKISSKLIDGNTQFLITWKLAKTWQIIDTRTGCTYTPKAFEAYFGDLPPCPPSANPKTRKEYYAHRKADKGFKPKNNPMRSHRVIDDFSG